MTIDEAFEILRSLPKDWGASEEDVCAVESKLGVRLPSPLRELMLRTGRGMHMQWLFPEGSIPPLHQLVDLQEIALEILEEDPPSLRPTFPFVTLEVHQGYEFVFARAGLQDHDAEVFYYRERDGFGPCVGSSLRSHIAAAVQRAMARG